LYQEKTLTREVERRCWPRTSSSRCRNRIYSEATPNKERTAYHTTMPLYALFHIRRSPSSTSSFSCYPPSSPTCIGYPFSRKQSTCIRQKTAQMLSAYCYLYANETLEKHLS